MRAKLNESLDFRRDVRILTEDSKTAREKKEVQRIRTWKRDYENL